MGGNSQVGVEQDYSDFLEKIQIGIFKGQIIPLSAWYAKDCEFLI